MCYILFSAAGSGDYVYTGNNGEACECGKAGKGNLVLVPSEENGIEPGLGGRSQVSDECTVPLFPRNVPAHSPYN